MTEKFCNNQSHMRDALVGRERCASCNKQLYGRPKDKCPKCFNYLPGCSCPPPADPMDDLFKVGPRKPLGYLPLKTIRSCGFKPGQVASDLENCELQTRFCTKEECKIVGGALYAWNHDALRELLDNNRSLLERNEWGITPDEFVQDVIAKDAQKDLNPELYALVGKAFSDRRFSP